MISIGNLLAASFDEGIVQGVLQFGSDDAFYLTLIFLNHKKTKTMPSKKKESER
jgi:hypothetical protein